MEGGADIQRTPGPGGAELWALRAWTPTLRRAGLNDPERWREAVARGAGAGGRGGSVLLHLEGCPPLRLKPLLRGGLARRLWGDRFPGRGRLLRNLLLPQEALRRGVATPAAAALLIVPAGPGLYQGYLALESVEPGESYLDFLRRTAPPAGDGARRVHEAVMRAVREAHDRGLEHPDLNAANLLLAPGGGDAAPEIWILDLDRARLRPGPLSWRRRRRALRRLERSIAKHAPGAHAALDGGRALYRAYAAGRPEWERRLEKMWRRGRLALRVHGAWGRYPDRG